MKTKTSSEQKLLTLQRRLESVRKQLQANVPDLIMEYEMLNELIQQRRANTNDFGTARTPYKAILLVLTERGTWMTKGEIVERLQSGGYITSDAQRWTTNTLLNHHSSAQVRNLQRIGPEAGWEALIGLPSWPPPENKVVNE